MKSFFLFSLISIAQWRLVIYPDPKTEDLYTPTELLLSGIFDDLMAIFILFSTFLEKACFSKWNSELVTQ